MKIEKLEIRNFGKMQNRTLEFSDGIQLISGENESGKSTVHTFIRSMLFGMTRGRGRAAKNDVYSRYEPWENPAYYAGEMVLESGGKRFRLTRNFGRQNANAKLVCLTARCSPWRTAIFPCCSAVSVRLCMIIRLRSGS